jgi:hypothetical protein
MSARLRSVRERERAVATTVPGPRRFHDAARRRLCPPVTSARCELQIEAQARSPRTRSSALEAEANRKSTGLPGNCRSAGS